METIFLASPSHDGRVDAGTAAGLYNNPAPRRSVMVAPKHGSLLTGNCNVLWAAALNAANQHGVKWFAMLHSDIEPQPHWLDALIDLAVEHDADMMSAVVPIKDERGVTSTAIENPDNPWAVFCRLTQRQVWHARFPATFDIAAAAAALRGLPDGLGVPDCPESTLLANTGCFAIRLDRPWIGTGRVFFENRDAIFADADGVWRAWTQSEDWLFSRRVHESGGRVMCTRAVKVIHKGTGKFPSDLQWGQATDADAVRVNAAWERQRQAAGRGRPRAAAAELEVDLL
jgi:GT2 family glycosyltransferase